MWAAAAAIAIILSASYVYKNLNESDQPPANGTTTLTSNKDQPGNRAETVAKEQAPVFIVIISKDIPEIQRRDGGLTDDANGTIAESVDHLNHLHGFSQAAHPTPRVQSPVKLMVKPVEFNPDM